MRSNPEIADEPPAVLACAVVRFFARLDDTVSYTGRGCIIVGSVTLDPVPCLVIAQNIEDGCVLLFYCDKDWRVLGAGGYDTILEAQATMERRYPGVESLWIPFRQLTEAEMRELNDTRQFLEDHPGPIIN
jgi:hypothetical protein